MIDLVAGAVVAVGGTLAAIKAIDRRRSTATVAETPEEDPRDPTPDRPHVRDLGVEPDTTGVCPHCGCEYHPDDVVPPDADPAEHGEYRYGCSIGTAADDDLAGHMIIHR
jgi:hypothetical protein